MKQHGCGWTSFPQQSGDTESPARSTVPVLPQRREHLLGGNWQGADADAAGVGDGVHEVGGGGDEAGFVGAARSDRFMG